MKVKQHPNYLESLLLLGAKVVEPLKMKPEIERGKGRMWTATAKLRLKGFEIHLHAYFHGRLTEVEEVAAANLNIIRVTMLVEGGASPDVKDYNRVGFALLLLDDGIYIQPEKSKKARAGVRAMCDYDTSQYVGLPTEDELLSILAFGYTKIISWTR